MSITELEKGLESCIRHCMETGEAPVAFVLHKFVDVSEGELAGFLENGERAKRGEIPNTFGVKRRFRLARKWEEFKTFYWLSIAQKEPKNASFAMFNLQQAETGGYGEREGKAEKAVLVVRLEGVGGTEGMK